MKSASSNTLNFMELNKFTADNLLTFSRIFIPISSLPLLDLMGHQQLSRFRDALA